MTMAALFGCAFAVRELFSKSMDLHQMLVAFTYQDWFTQNFWNTVSTAVTVLSESWLSAHPLNLLLKEWEFPMWIQQGQEWVGPGLGERGNSDLQYGTKEVETLSEGTWRFGLNWSCELASRHTGIHRWPRYNPDTGFNVQGKSLGHQILFSKNSVKPY